MSSTTISDKVLDFGWKTFVAGAIRHGKGPILQHRQVVLDTLESAGNPGLGDDRLVRIGDVTDFLREDGDVVDHAMAARIERKFVLRASAG